jgi:FMN phosphatase YigB (HAD superfamily)
LRAILFDLDGTLLDLPLDDFFHRYFGALRDSAGPAFPGIDLVARVADSTGAMMRSHPGQTNQEAFNADFLATTGIDITTRADVLDHFYADVFPGLSGEAGPAKGGRRAVEAALGLGLRVAVATNPIFPATAIRHRIAWAGLEDLPLAVVTSYELMHSTKPHAAYFEETAAMLGVEPRECMMVGDDASLDLPASATGMRTYYVGSGDGSAADLRGDLDALADLLPGLAG